MYKVIWSSKAKDNLKNALEYWLGRNKSNSYPKKIVADIFAKENFLLTNPFFGKKPIIKG